MSQTKAQLISDLVQALNFTGTSSAPANGLFLSASNTLQLSTASTPRLTVNSDGHVDVIGNLDVGAGLDVTGAITGTGDVTITKASPVLRLADTTDPQSAEGSIGKIEFYGSDGSSGGVDVRSYIQTVSTNATGNAHALVIGLGISNNAPTEKIRILDDGKVGITRVPTQHPLEIQHTSEPTVSFWRASTKGAAFQAQSGGTYIYSYEDAPLLFSVNSASGYTKQLQITDGTADFTGKVGIGTASPTGIHNLAKVLEISGGDGGDLIIGNNASSNIGAGAHIGAIAFKNIDSSTGSVPHYAGIRCEATDTSGNMDLRFYTGIANLEADTPQMYIDSVGRLSIQGTATRGVLEVRASGGSNTMLTALFGANEGGTTGALTDDTDKGCRIGIQHYDTDALPFAWISASSGATSNAIYMGGGTSLMNAATEVGIYTAANSTTATGIKRFTIGTDGTLHKYWNGTTIQASFGGSGQVNGITALPSMAATPFVVGRDTGSTRSAHFGGHLKFDDGYGIDFSATGGPANSASGTSELFADYEEGVFSPTLEVGGSTTGVSYAGRTGSYTKVGRLVTINGSLSMSDKGSNTGQIHFANLPFTVSDLQANTQHEASGSIGYFAGMANNIYFATITAVHSSTEVLFTIQKAHDLAVEHATDADIGDNLTVRYSISYFST